MRATEREKSRAGALFVFLTAFILRITVGRVRAIKKPIDSGESRVGAGAKYITDKKKNITDK